MAMPDAYIVIVIVVVFFYIIYYMLHPTYYIIMLMFILIYYPSANHRARKPLSPGLSASTLHSSQLGPKPKKESFKGD